MKNKQYEELKEEYVEHITSMMQDLGEIQPHITIFAEQLHPKEGEEDKPAIIHMFIPNEFMDSDDGKQKFIDEMLPEVAAEVKKDFIPKAIGWASEAWMRTIDKGSDFDIDKDDYKNLPIKNEVIIITIESEDEQDAIIYKIKRDGTQVNKYGDLTDNIKLEILEGSNNSLKGMSGKFSGLFKNFKS